MFEFKDNYLVSSIEFDKDQEFFAIAGVTKRIKIYAYNNVLKVRILLEVLYPKDLLLLLTGIY